MATRVISSTVVTFGIVVLTSLTAATCGKKSGSSSSDDVVVQVPFRAVVGDEEFDCQKAFVVGDDSTNVLPKDFRYFVSKVNFLRSDGTKEPLRLEQDGKWQTDDIALLDFATDVGNCAKSSSPDSATRTFIRGVVPKGTYEGIEFDLGVDDATNHLDASVAKPPLNNPGMWWSWKGGYKELRLEFTMTSDGPAKDKDYLFHYGATGCSGTGTEDFKCADENNLTVSLKGDPLKSVVSFDIKMLLKGENVQVKLTQNKDTKKLDVVPTPFFWGCMAFPGDGNCEILFSNLGKSFLNAVGARTPSQQVFSLVSGADTTKSTSPDNVETDPAACSPQKKALAGDPCFERDAALNLELEVGDQSYPSGPSGFVSHNAGQACISCHQVNGPGKGLHTFSGTVYNADLKSIASGAKVKLFSDAARTQLLKEFVTDASGNFYTTKDYLSEIDNPEKQYWVTVTDSEGGSAKNMMGAKMSGQCSHCHIGGQRIWINK